MGEHQVQDGISGEQLRLFMRNLLDDLRALRVLVSPTIEATPVRVRQFDVDQALETADNPQWPDRRFGGRTSTSMLSSTTTPRLRATFWRRSSSKSAIVENG